MDTWLKNESLEKRVGGGEKQRQLGADGMDTVEEKLELILWMLKMIGSTWREAHRLERIDMTISMIKRISTPIETWEHHLKGMESTLDFEATRIPQQKQNKEFGS